MHVHKDLWVLFAASHSRQTLSCLLEPFVKSALFLAPHTMHAHWLCCEQLSRQRCKHKGLLASPFNVFAHVEVLVALAALCVEFLNIALPADGHVVERPDIAFGA